MYFEFSPIAYDLDKEYRDRKLQRSLFIRKSREAQHLLNDTVQTVVANTGQDKYTDHQYELLPHWSSLTVVYA